MDGIREGNECKGLEGIGKDGKELEIIGRDWKGLERIAKNWKENGLEGKGKNWKGSNRSRQYLKNFEIEYNLVKIEQGMLFR